jgi:uncharacterized protein (TIRG00374 family)
MPSPPENAMAPESHPTCVPDSSLSESGIRKKSEPRVPAVRLKRGFLLLLSLSVLLTLAVPFWLSGWEGFGSLLRLPAWTVLTLLLMMIASWVFNTSRVRLLIRAMGREVGFLDGGMIVFATEFAGVATPASAGMPVTYAFLFRKFGLNFGHAMGLLSIIVLLDILFFGLAMSGATVALVFSESIRSLPRAAGLTLVVVGGGAVFLWLLISYHRRLFNLVSRGMGRIPWLARYRYRLARVVVEFIRALRILKGISWPQRVKLFVHTLGYWLPRYGVLVVAIRLVRGVAPLAYLFLVQGLLNLGGQVVILPSGGGGVDAAYSALMHPYLDHRDIAFTLLVWRAFTFYWYLVIGAPIFFLKTGQAARRLLTRKG